MNSAGMLRTYHSSILFLSGYCRGNITGNTNLAPTSPLGVSLLPYKNEKWEVKRRDRFIMSIMSQLLQPFAPWSDFQSHILLKVFCLAGVKFTMCSLTILWTEQHF